MASNSQESVEKIKERIDEIQDDTEKVVFAMKNGTEEVKMERQQ